MREVTPKSGGDGTGDAKHGTVLQTPRQSMEAGRRSE
jgi:hypothetical protein